MQVPVVDDSDAAQPSDDVVVDAQNANTEPTHSFTIWGGVLPPNAEASSGPNAQPHN